jgi:hypothetical protein
MVPPRAAGNGVVRTLDPGSENIMKASELSSDALRASYDECANRAVRLARSNVERAEEDLRDAEAFAQAVRAHGKQMAEKLEAGFSRASDLAARLADGEALIEKSK